MGRGAKTQLTSTVSRTFCVFTCYVSSVMGCTVVSRTSQTAKAHATSHLLPASDAQVHRDSLVRNLAAVHLLALSAPPKPIITKHLLVLLAGKRRPEVRRLCCVANRRRHRHCNGL